MTRPDPASLLPARAFPEAPDLAPDARVARFLEEYWRRRWLLLPGALNDLPELLDGDELAGLACEWDADARIVERCDGRFVQETGPFEPKRFEQLGERDWTLLVNGVDLMLPGFEPLLAMLRFVPDWRIDDIMASFAAPGGSVGPHFDRYDVFLVQLEGRRRWELGRQPDGPGREPCREHGLDLVADFVPDDVVYCEPGDVLYVPPTLVHHGIAETPCLTLSLGLRAPSTGDLVAAWSEFCVTQTATLPLELDPPLPADPARLAPETVSRARSALREALLEDLDAADDDRMATWLGCALTRPGRSASPADVPRPLAPAALTAELDNGAVLERSPGTRLLSWEYDERRTLFAGGQAFVADDLTAAELAAFLNQHRIAAGSMTSAAARRLASELYNAGWLFLDDSGDAS